MNRSFPFSATVTLKPESVERYHRGKPDGSALSTAAGNLFYGGDSDFVSALCFSKPYVWPRTSRNSDEVLLSTALPPGVNYAIIMVVSNW